MCPPGFGGSPVVRGRPAPQTGSQFRRGIKGVQKDPRRRRPRHSAGIDARLTGRVQCRTVKADPVVDAGTGHPWAAEAPRGDSSCRQSDSSSPTAVERSASRDARGAGRANQGGCRKLYRRRPTIVLPTEPMTAVDDTALSDRTDRTAAKDAALVRMTLVEHLTELRRRLLISIAAVAAATLIAFFFTTRSCISWPSPTDRLRWPASRSD